MGLPFSTHSVVTVLPGRYPFNLESEVAILRDKKDQAKVWLEKLKKTFGMAKRAGGRKNQEEVGEGNKLSLAEMRMLVEAGTTMYAQEEEVDEDAMASVSTKKGEYCIGLSVDGGR